MRGAKFGELASQQEGPSEELIALRSLIQRFPFWLRGRAILGRLSIESNDIATAYAEAQALRALSRENSDERTLSLSLLGQCYLRRGDGASALALLNQAADIRPNDTLIKEEQAAALVLLGEKAKAHEILKRIPATHLSAEGKAALQWLSTPPS